MFGNNKILPPTTHDGDFLDVQEIFATLQGEGNFVGQPAVFVRLGGCNLACKFCDTDFDNFEKISLTNILQKIHNLALNQNNKRVRNLVVITGGEPLRQPIEKFCQKLINDNFLVQIETNGTLFRNLPKEVKIICSPKFSNKKIAPKSSNFNLQNSQKNSPKTSQKTSQKTSEQTSQQISAQNPSQIYEQYYSIRPDLLERITSLKFIISATRKTYSSVPDVGQNQFNIPVYVQPMDEYDEQKNYQNLQLAIKLCDENGYFLSLQTHKIVGLK